MLFAGMAYELAPGDYRLAAAAGVRTSTMTMRDSPPATHYMLSLRIGSRPSSLA
jgi:hypothetical protein